MRKPKDGRAKSAATVLLRLDEHEEMCLDRLRAPGESRQDVLRRLIRLATPPFAEDEPGSLITTEQMSQERIEALMRMDRRQRG